jgi:hypothetical protein
VACLSEIKDIRKALDDLRGGGGVPGGLAGICLELKNAPEDNEYFALSKQLLSECASRYPNHPFDIHVGGDEVEDNLYPASELASMLNQIPLNQLKSLSLSDMQLTESIEILLEALRRQPQLQEFTMYDMSVGPNDLHLLAAHLISLPHLKKIEWDCDCYSLGDTPNDYRVLTAILLAQKNGLEEIDFYGLPSPWDLQGLFHELQNNSSLKRVKIYLAGSHTMSAQNIQHVAWMIQQNPSIEELALKDCDSFGPICAVLHNNSFLKALDIYSFYHPLSSEGSELAGQMLRQNASIERLILPMPNPGVSVGPLTNTLGTDNNTLKVLHLDTMYYDSKVWSEENSEHLGHMLRSNASIEELKVPVCPLLPIARALEANNSLKTLKIYGLILCDQARALLGVLENQNLTLETLKTGRKPEAEQILRKIDFYLALNRVFHRKRLLSPGDENATTEEWVEVIVSARKTTDIVFYYLSKNLSLITGANLNCPALMVSQSGIAECYNSINSTEDSDSTYCASEVSESDSESDSEDEHNSIFSGGSSRDVCYDSDIEFSGGGKRRRCSEGEHNAL